LLCTGKWEAYPEGGARINGIDKCATMASHATQQSPAPAQRYNQRQRISSGVRPLAGRRPAALTFKNADDAKRFYSAVQNEITRLALYSLEEEARRYVLGEVRVRTKDKPTSIR
jgi:hypothetical protein